MTTGALTLADGRRLRWHESGDPHGSPVSYTTGTPVSGLYGQLYGERSALTGCRGLDGFRTGGRASGAAYMHPVRRAPARRQVPSS